MCVLNTVPFNTKNISFRALLSITFEIQYKMGSRNEIVKSYKNINLEQNKRRTFFLFVLYIMPAPDYARIRNS